MKCAIILAGGKGTRMKADCPKVMCKVLMKPMIDYVVSAVKSAGCAAICVITGYRHTEVEDHLRNLDPTIETALQEPSWAPATRSCAPGILLSATGETIFWF